MFVFMNEKECFENEFLIFRELKEDDYGNDYFNLLSQLTKAENISENDFKNALTEINKNGNVFVFEDKNNGKIAATAKLLIEQKLIRGGGKVGHLEDVVVDKDYRKYGLGKKIVLNLVDLAKEKGCYKIIGNCDDSVIKFYEKIGFENKGNEIAIYF